MRHMDDPTVAIKEAFAQGVKSEKKKSRRLIEQARDRLQSCVGMYRDGYIESDHAAQVFNAADQALAALTAYLEGQDA